MLSRIKNYIDTHDDKIRIYPQLINEDTEDKVYFLVFECSIRVLDPEPIIDDAIEEILCDYDYSEFVDCNLDNPWIRVAITNFDIVKSLQKPVTDYADCYLHQGRLKVWFISGGYDFLNPWKSMEGEAFDIVQKTDYGCIQTVERNLDNPWDRVCFSDINDLDEYSILGNAWYGQIQ